MKPALSLLLVLILYAGVFADDTKPKVLQQELEKFSGIWEIVHVQPAGATKDAKYLVFRKDQTYAALDASKKERWAGTFDLDPTATPKIWDHRSTESEKTGGDVLGIYQLDGDQLKVSCVAGVWKEKQWTGKPRPEKFELPAADVVIQLKRVKSDE